MASTSGPVPTTGTAPRDGSFGLSWRDDAIAVRAFGVRERRQRAPLLLYFHGGHFNCGAPGYAEALARAVSEVAVVVCVAYPLAPRFRFPETVEVAYEALRWAQAAARGYGADPARIVIGGDLAGGNLAAATALVARDRQLLCPKLRPLAAQVLVTPLLDPAQDSVSMRAIVHHPTRQGWAAYLPRIGDAAHPYAAPLHSKRLAKLPPALIVSADGCPLRDEAEAYAGRLAGAGVPVRMQRMKEAKGNLVNPAHPRFAALAEAVTSFVAGA